MADIDPEDPEFLTQLVRKIRQRFINQVGPFKVVDLIHQVDKNVLTDEDIEHIKTCTRSDGNFVGAEELFNRLTQYRGWFDCLMSALRQVLPEVATKLAGDYDEVLEGLRTTRSDEVHLREGKGCVSLLEASSRGHVGCLKGLLSGEVDVNSKNERGETAVYLAAEGGHAECLDILIQAGCDAALLNGNKDCPLFVATKKGFSQCVKILISALTSRPTKSRLNVLERGGKHGFTPVSAAAAKGHVECLKLLLQAGASTSNCAIDRPDGITPLMAAALEGKEKCAQILIDAKADINAIDEYGRTPLLIAAMEGKVKCLQVLIEAGADINRGTTQDESPLLVATGYHQFECVSLLLTAGADIHMKNKSGHNALMVAAKVGDEESLQALVDAGSNLNARDNDGKTALIHATINGFDICGKILVENGSDIHLKDKFGKTALHYASIFSLLPTILVDVGADVNTSDNNGETPLMAAVRRDRPEVLQYLIRKGADVQKVNNEGQTALTIAQSKKVGGSWICLNLLRRNKRTELSHEEYEEIIGKDYSLSTIGDGNTNDGSNKEDSDKVSQSGIEHVETLTRSHEVECYLEADDTLKKYYTKCKKNPGHVDFISITEFGLSHLPDKYLDQRIVDVIKAEAELTVRLLVKYTSPARPDGYNASNMRGKKGGRVGSGWILGGVLKRTISENKKCPCPECENSADPQMEWMQLLIKTAIHVVYDSAEAKNTVVHIFADVDKPKDMHRFYGYEVCSYSHDDDECEFYAATHDLQLYGYLESMVKHRRKTWRCSWDIGNNFVAIVSHPHGCSKQVTTGEWVSRFPAEGPSIKSKYIYNVPTCPGSSGAPVIVFRKNNSGTIHPHSRRASQDLGQNLSGSSSTEGQIYGANPIIGIYPKALRENTGTGKMLPKGWETLIEPEQERPTSPVQPLYDYQQRPPPPPPRLRPPPPPPPATTTTTPAGH